MTIIHLWSSPRNISTALMYAFSRHPEIKVVDEPLYGHYLTQQTTAAEHPGRAEIIAGMEVDAERVIDELFDAKIESKYLLCKQMTHHLARLDVAQRLRLLGLQDDLQNNKPTVQNVLLIRNPRAILSSFSKVVREVTAADIGVPQQYALFQELKSAGNLAAVVDARKLLLNPGELMKKLCDCLGLVFTEAMLNWPAGPIPEDGVWAKYWYANVHRSTGFQPYEEKAYPLSEAMEKIARELEGAYQEMLAATL